METKELPALRDVVLNAEFDAQTFLAARRVFFAQSEQRAELDRLAPEATTPLRKALVADLRGQRREACALLEQARGQPWVSYWLGYLLLEEGRVKEARDGLEAAYKAAPDPHLGGLLVEARALTRDEAGARALLESLEALVGSSEHSYLEGLVLEVEGEYGPALQHYEKAVASERNARFLFRLGYLAALHGSEDRARHAYEGCVRNPPVHVRAAINLGILYEDNEDYENAVWCYESVLNAHPDHERAGMYLSDAEASLDMYYDREKEKERHRRKQLLQIPVTDFELSVRSRNCLAKMNIHTLGDLVQKSEAELLSYKNFGETSLAEIKKILAQKGFRLGQSADDRSRPTAATPDPEKSSLLNEPVSLLELSSRAQRCMDRLGIETLADLVKRTELELINQRNFGVTSLNEVKRKLKERGLALAGG